MANSSSQKQEISLTSLLDLNRNQAKVYPFDRFNKKNGTIYGECLAPYHRKTEDNSEYNSVIYDSKGNKYSTDTDGKFYVNDVMKYNRSDYNFSFSLEECDAEVIYCSQTEDFKVFRKQNVDSFTYKYQYGDETPVSICTQLRAVTNAIDVIAFEDGYLSANYTLSPNIVFFYYITHEGISLLGYKYVNTTVLDSSILSDPIIQLGVLNSSADTKVYGCSIIARTGTNLKKQAKDCVSMVFTVDVTEGIQNYYVNPSVTISSGDLTLFPYQDYVFIHRNNGNKKDYLDMVIYSDYTSAIASSDYYISFAAYFDASGISAGSTITVTKPSVYIYQANLFNLMNFVCIDYTIYKGVFLADAVIKSNAGNFGTLRFYYDQTGLPTVCYNCYANIDTTLENLTADDHVKNNNSIVFFDTFYKRGEHSAVLWGIAYQLSLSNGYFTGIQSAGSAIIPLNLMSASNPPVIDFEGNLYFSDDNNTAYKVTVNHFFSIIDIIQDQYIIMNNLGMNVYDIKNDTALIFADGFNAPITPKQAADFGSTILFSPSSWELGELAASYNPFYEITGNPFISAQLAPITAYFNKNLDLKTYLSVLWANSFQIDYFFSWATDSAIPVYQFSSSNRINSLYTGLTYPSGTDVILPPSLTSKFINSYNNHDFVIQGSTGYPLIYFNNELVMGYYSLSFVENVKAIFTLQTSSYAVTKNKIMAITFDGNNIDTTTVLGDITGLEYIGALPELALFFSPFNRKLYSFTGDAMLNHYADTNVIAQYYGAFYLPTSNSILLSCQESDGTDCVYIIQQDNMVRIENPEITRVSVDWNNNNDLILVSDGEVNKLRYEAMDGYTPDLLHIETGFLGLGNEQTLIASCWCIRLYTDEIAAGSVSFQCNTLTNEGIKTQTKLLKIDATMWDTLTKTLYVRFQPTYQAGAGVQLVIDSDFPIYEIALEYQPDTTQISRVNI